MALVVVKKHTVCAGGEGEGGTGVLGVVGGTGVVVGGVGARVVAGMGGLTAGGPGLAVGSGQVEKILALVSMQILII